MTCSYDKERTCPSCNTFLVDLKPIERTNKHTRIRALHHLDWIGQTCDDNRFKAVCPQCQAIFHTCHKHQLKRANGTKEDCSLNCYGNTFDEIDHACDFNNDEDSVYMEQDLWMLNSMGNSLPHDLNDYKTVPGYSHLLYALPTDNMLSIVWLDPTMPTSDHLVLADLSPNDTVQLHRPTPDDIQRGYLTQYYVLWHNIRHYI